MIGGRDIVIPTRIGSAALDVALRAALRLWPGAVCEDAETGEVLPRVDDVRPSQCREVLIYRDAAAADAWRELGADPSLNDTLIHLLSSESTLTVVLDDEPSQELLAYASSVEGLLVRAGRSTTAMP